MKPSKDVFHYHSDDFLRAAMRWVFLLASHEAFVNGLELFAVNALYMFVSGALYPLIPLYLEEQRIGIMERGLILTAAALVGAVSSLFWGYLSDKLGKRRIFVLLGGASQMLAYLLLAVLLPRSRSLSTLVLLYLLSCFFGPASFTLVMASAGSGGEVSTAMSNFWAGGSLGWAIGTAVSGWVYERFGIAAVFLASAALLAPYTLIAFRASRDVAPVSAKRGKSAALPRPLLLLLLLVFVFMCVDVLKNLYVPPHYAYDLGLGAATAMLTLSFTSWLEIPSIIAFGRLARRLGKWVILALSLLLAALYLALNCLAQNALHAFALMGFYSTVWGSFSVSSSALVAELTEALGTGYGAYNMVYSLANIAAPLIASTFMNAFGYGTLLSSFAALSTACGIIAACKAKAEKR